MNSRIIDLTGDSSEIELAKAPAASMPRAKRQPLRAVKNGAGKQVPVALPAKPIVSAVLKKAIETVPAHELRMWVISYCERITPLREGLEEQLLVSGKDVVRYHKDSDSENKSCDSEISEEDEDEDDNDERKARKGLKPIRAADDEMVPKYFTCLNCKENFDISNNERGYCRWHTGEKEIDWEGDFWADHDEDCHGQIDSFMDEPDYAEGFIWSCCQEPGDNEGCKSTKHKAAVNEIRYPPPVVISTPETSSRKRKAERQMQRPTNAR